MVYIKFFVTLYGLHNYVPRVALREVKNFFGRLLV